MRTGDGSTVSTDADECSDDRERDAAVACSHYLSVQGRFILAGHDLGITGETLYGDHEVSNDRAY